MTLLQAYISKTVMAAILMVLLVIVGIDLISAILEEIGDIKGNYDYPQVLQYALYTVPSRIYTYIPFAALIGCLVGLGSLAGNSELVVMRAAGISITRLVFVVMRPAAVMMALGFAIGEYIAPPAEQIAQSRRALALYGEAAELTRGGVWNREGNVFMHFNVVQPNGILHGVSLFEFDGSGRLQRARFGQRATFQRDHWILEEVSDTVLEPLNTRVEEYKTLRWDTEITPGLLSVVVVDPDDLSIRGLWKYANYLQGQGLHNGEYLLAFWKKVFQPLATISLVLIAVSFIFGPLRSVTMGYRIFIGVLFGILFQMAQNMLGPSSLVFGFPPIYASLVPVGVCFVIGLLLLSRVR